MVAKEPAGRGSVTFRLEPADATPATVARPGQYVSVRVRLADGLRQCRQYSLSEDAASTTTRVFTTKLDEGGEVSPFLHHSVQVGDVVTYSVQITQYGEGAVQEAIVTDDVTAVLDDATWNDDATASAGEVSFEEPILTWTGCTRLRWG